VDLGTAYAVAGAGVLLLVVGALAARPALRGREGDQHRATAASEMPLQDAASRT
jgi:hypothetical protein